jgi:predicted phosphodiesterase
MVIKNSEHVKDDVWKISIQTDAPEIEIMALCCLHVGAHDHDRDLFLKYRDWLLESPDRYIMSIGDLGDYSIPTHMPYTMWKQDQSPNEQIKEIIDLLDPVKDRIIGLVDGNHELRIWKKTSLNPNEWIGDKLDAPYMGIDAYIILEVNGIEYKTFWIHGERAGLPETVLRYAFYSGRASDTDFFVVGHSHTFAMREFNRIKFDGFDKITERVTGVRTASFLTDADYSRRKLYDLSHKGSSIISVSSRSKRWSVDNSGEYKFA